MEGSSAKAPKEALPTAAAAGKLKTLPPKPLPGLSPAAAAGAAAKVPLAAMKSASKTGPAGSPYTSASQPPKMKVLGKEKQLLFSPSKPGPKDGGALAASHSAAAVGVSTSAVSATSKPSPPPPLGLSKPSAAAVVPPAAAKSPGLAEAPLPAAPGGKPPAAVKPPALLSPSAAAKPGFAPPVVGKPAVVTPAAAAKPGLAAVAPAAKAGVPTPAGLGKPSFGPAAGKPALGLAASAKPALSPAAAGKPALVPPAAGGKRPLVAPGAPAKPALGPGVPAAKPALAPAAVAKPALGPAAPAAKPALAPAAPAAKPALASAKPALAPAAKPALAPAAKPALAPAKPALAPVAKPPLVTPPAGGKPAPASAAPAKLALVTPSAATKAGPILAEDAMSGLTAAAAPSSALAAADFEKKTPGVPTKPAVTKPVTPTPALVKAKPAVAAVVPGVDKTSAVAAAEKTGPAAAPPAGAAALAKAALLPAKAPAAEQHPKQQEPRVVPLGKATTAAEAKIDSAGGVAGVKGSRAEVAAAGVAAKQAELPGVKTAAPAAADTRAPAADGRKPVAAGRAAERRGDRASETSSSVESGASEELRQPWTRAARSSSRRRRESSRSRGRQQRRKGSSRGGSSDESHSPRAWQKTVASHIGERSSSSLSSSVSEQLRPTGSPQQLARQQRTHHRRVTATPRDGRRRRPAAEPFSPRLPPSFMHTAAATAAAYEASVAAGTASPAAASATERRSHGVQQLWGHSQQTQCDRVYVRRQPREGTQIIYVTAHLESLLLRLFLCYSYNLYMTETRWIQMCTDTGLLSASDKDPDVLKYIFRGVVQHKEYLLAEFDELLQLLVRLARYKFRKHQRAISEEGALNAVIAQLLRGADRLIGDAADPGGHRLEHCGIQVCCSTREIGICCIPSCHTVETQTCPFVTRAVGVQAQPSVWEQGTEAAVTLRPAATNTPYLALVTASTQTDPEELKTETRGVQWELELAGDWDEIRAAAEKLRKLEEKKRQKAARCRATQVHIPFLDEAAYLEQRSKKIAVWRAWKKLRQCVALAGEDESRLFTVFCNYSSYDPRALQNLMTERSCAALCRDSYIVSVDCPTHPIRGVSPEEAERLYHLVLRRRPSGILLQQEQQQQPLLRTLSSFLVGLKEQGEEEEEGAQEEEEATASPLARGRPAQQQQPYEGAKKPQEPQLRPAQQQEASTQQQVEERAALQKKQQLQQQKKVAMGQVKKEQASSSSKSGDLIGEQQPARGVAVAGKKQLQVPGTADAAAGAATYQATASEAAAAGGKQTLSPKRDSRKEYEGLLSPGTASPRMEKSAAGGAAAVQRGPGVSDAAAAESGVAAAATARVAAEKVDGDKVTAAAAEERDTRITYIEFKGLLYYLASRLYEDYRPRKAFLRTVRDHVVHHYFKNFSPSIEEERRRSRERRQSTVSRQTVGYEDVSPMEGYYEEDAAPGGRRSSLPVVPYVELHNLKRQSNGSTADAASDIDWDEFSSEDEEEYEEEEEDEGSDYDEEDEEEDSSKTGRRTTAIGPVPPMYHGGPFMPPTPAFLMPVPYPPVLSPTSPT